MTAETSNARGEVVAWFPTNAQGEIIRNYGDGSPVYACKTKEEAEQASRCHLGATGPVIPLYAAPPPAAARVDVRGLVALAEQMERDAAGCRRDGYIDAAVVKEDCAQRIRQTLGISAIAEALAAEGVQAGEVSAEDVAVLHRLKAALPDVGVNGWYEGVQALERVLARLSQQPEARGVVDEAMVERATTAYLQSRGTYEGEVPVDRDDIRAALTAALAQQPAAVDGADAKLALANDISRVFGNTNKAMTDHLWSLGYRKVATPHQEPPHDRRD